MVRRSEKFAAFPHPPKNPFDVGHKKLRKSSGLAAGAGMGGGNDEREQTLNQILTAALTKGKRLGSEGIS